MQTRISERFAATPEGQEAERILRSCVHCGFCTATCPTYQLLGDELDGPRGRIYLIKEFLEGQEVSARTRLHLDRCLTCRSCETTCPSGVRYGRLADIGRALLETETRRSWLDVLTRKALRLLLPFPRRIAPLLRVAQLCRPLLPAALRQRVPAVQSGTRWPRQPRARRMLVLEGCVQPLATPRTNAAAARVLDRLGIELSSARGAGCCGALSHHLAAEEEGLEFIRRNIDAWWPHLEAGAEAVVITATGCATLVKEYGELLRGDPSYADKAARVAALTRDIGEVLSAEALPAEVRGKAAGRRIAFHSPCTLQHGQRLDGVVEKILEQAGFQLVGVADPHLCCGSAGTYSILQPQLSQRLLHNKLQALEAEGPEVIATGNIGCQMHLASRAGRPVRHWIELLDELMAERAPEA